MSNGNNSRLERKQDALLYDTRKFGDRFRDALANEETAAFSMIAFGVGIFFAKQFAEILFILGVAFFFFVRRVQKKAGLCLRMPKSSGEMDPKDIHPGTGKPVSAGGIVYMGVDSDSGEEVWLTDNMARTHMLFMGTTGSGKAQPLDARVHTPSGWKRMGELQVGESVSIPAGGSARVSGVFPQGKLPIYRITFADDRSTEACGEHLWEVHHNHLNGKKTIEISEVGVVGSRNLTTERVLGLLPLVIESGGSLSVRLPRPVEMPKQSVPLLPYLLGVFLADALAFSQQLGKECGRESAQLALVELSLDGVAGEFKFVPESYKNASIDQRRQLLCGLMDTDGVVCPDGSVSLTTTSQRLAEDIQYLVRSLGGIASVTAGGTTEAQAKSSTRKIAFTVDINHPDLHSLFTVECKSSLVATYQYADSLKLAIKKIELVGEKDAQCIMVDHDDHLYITDDFVVTHNTEYLISLVYNALIHGSGLIYVDGKADSSLYGKVYSMARSMGREDDVLVINFQTGAKDIYGAQPNKLSNTLNPFSVGSSGMLSELVKGLMATGEKSTWTQQAESFVEALIKPLVFMRDHHGLNLDVNVIRSYFELNLIEDLAWKDPERYPGLETSGSIDGIRAYLMNKPGYKKEKYHDQADTTLEQHGYISMQLGRTFNSLSDTYGYIMKTPLAEIDFVDVFLNRRILVVLLPALEKSPTELTNLGRIVVASIKATMAKGLGSAIEGDWAKIITAKPTNSPSPFMSVFDEYGYYAVEGFAVVPAQARSLGFSAIFAGQDLPAFEKASKEEAKSTLANTNTKLCGKLECIDTYKYFQSLGGQGLFTRVGRFETDRGSMGLNSFTADESVNVDRMDRVSLETLRGQLSGEWNLFYGNTLLSVKSFFADPKPVKQLRVNHFIKVARPSPEEVAIFKSSSDKFKRAVLSDGGMKSFMDVAGSVADLKDVMDAFNLFKSSPSLLCAGMVLANGQQMEASRAKSMSALITVGSFSDAEEIEDDYGNFSGSSNIPIDFAGQIGGETNQPTAFGNQENSPWSIPSGVTTQTSNSSGELDSEEEKNRRLFNDLHSEIVDFSVDHADQIIKSPLVFGPVFGDSVAAATPDHGVDQEEFPFVDGDLEIEPGFVDHHSADDLYGDGFGNGKSEAVRSALISGANSVVDEFAQSAEFEDGYSDQFEDSANIFSGDIAALDRVSLAGNDGDFESADVPQQLTDIHDSEFDLAPEFDEPQATQGQLSRDATVSGLAAIERASGASDEESRMTANIVAGDLGASTKYPMMAPTKRPDLKEFASVASRVSAMLNDTADMDD